MAGFVCGAQNSRLKPVNEWTRINYLLLFSRHVFRFLLRAPISCDAGSAFSTVVIGSAFTLNLLWAVS